MNELLDRFNNVYKALYDNDVSSNFILIEAFEKLCKEKVFKDKLQEFISYRHDALTSDREIVAYMLIINT